MTTAAKVANERSRFETAVLTGRFLDMTPRPGKTLTRYGKGYADPTVDNLWQAWQLMRAIPRDPYGWLYRTKGSRRWLFTDAVEFYRDTLCHDKSFEYRAVYV